MLELTRDKYLTDPELGAFLRALRDRRHAHALRNRALFALLANVGMRPSEALALRWRDFNLSDADPTVRVRRLKKRKALGVIDDMPLSRSLGRLVRDYRTAAARDALPPSAKIVNPDARAFPIGLRNAEVLFKRYLRLAGLADTFKLYALRHTAATRTWRATRDLLLVQKQLGHASAVTSQIYTHVDPEARRRAAELSGNAI